MESRNIIASVAGCTSVITMLNVKTRQTRLHPMIYEYGSPKFFDQFQSIISLNKIKALIIRIFGNEFSTYSADYHFRLACREFCEKHGIFCYFPFSQYADIVAALTQTQTLVKEGERVLLLTAMLPRCSPICYTLKRGKENYECISMTISLLQPFSSQWKAAILASSKPTRTILSTSESVTDPNDVLKMKQLFKNENFTVFRSQSGWDLQANVATVLHLMGEKINQYHVGLFCCHLYQIRVDGKIVIQTPDVDSLPFEKSAIIDVHPAKSVMLYGQFDDCDSPDLFEEIKLATFKSKQVKITLKLDINSFYDFKVEPFDKGEVDEMMSKINLGADKPNVDLEKARMVFNKQHFSVFGFADGKECALKDENGLTKTPIYISFHEVKPVIGKAAMEIYAEKPKFVVFDLIKLCSVITDDICNPKWGFRLSKEDGTLIVTMQTFEDERKSTVAFLLALIIKNGLSQIKKEYGRKMDDLEIGFDGFHPNETLKKNFVEAGKLLKIGIVFV